jgi:hypothetical protein
LYIYLSFNFNDVDKNHLQLLQHHGGRGQILQLLQYIKEGFDSFDSILGRVSGVFGVYKKDIQSETGTL